MSIDFDIEKFQTHSTPPSSIVSKIKYNPERNSLNALTDGINYIKGDVYFYESSSLRRVLHNATTSVPQEDALSVFVTEYETSITKYKRIWESIPTIEDYFDLDAIANVDEVETEFYKASKEFGW